MLNTLENSLAKLFATLPKLPEAAKETIAQIAPWASLISGALSLISAYSLWNWAHVSGAYVDYANELSEAFGGATIADERLTLSIWLGMAALLVQAVLLLLAFKPLQKRLKSGWNLLFYALLVNIVYAIIVIFSDYTGSVLGPIIGTVLGLWLLFQIRGKYKGAGAKAKA